MGSTSGQEGIRLSVSVTECARLHYSGCMQEAGSKCRPPEPLPAFSADGVDLTLIRWMLSLTVEERLQLLEDHAAFAWELRHANPSVQLPQHPRSS
jgi:hypothetical protein